MEEQATSRQPFCSGEDGKHSAVKCMLGTEKIKTDSQESNLFFLLLPLVGKDNFGPGP